MRAARFQTDPPPGTLRPLTPYRGSSRQMAPFNGALACAIAIGIDVPGKTARRQNLEVLPARAREDAQVELWQDGVEVVEYIGLDAFVGGPCRRVVEAVDFEGQTFGVRRKLAHHDR